jgi:two-component system, NarL family, response regulator YdfI
VIRVFIVAASSRARSAVENLLLGSGSECRVEIAGSGASLDSIEDRLADAQLDGAEIDGAQIDVVLIDASSESLESILDNLNDSGLADELPIVLLSEHPSPGWSAEALRAGVRAVLAASAAPEQLYAAIQAAAAGLVVLQAADVNAALPAAAGPSTTPPVAELAEPLTRREREVLQMLAAGLGNKEIAARLNISDHTAKFHVASILGKLGASTRTQAVALGIRHGLILL